MKVILYIIVIYLVIRYLLRPLLMAIAARYAGKMMKDMQGRAANPQKKEPVAQAPQPKPTKEVPGEYIDYEEVK